MNKGQAVLLDFALAALLFTLAWAVIMGQFNSTLGETALQAKIDSMRIKADSTLETLVKTKGVPNNWESLPLSDVNTIGLAVSDRTLSEAKLSAFQNLSADYNSMKEKLDLPYDFYFFFEGADVASAGLAPMGDATKIVAQRIVEYKGGTGIASLTLYELE